MQDRLRGTGPLLRQEGFQHRNDQDSTEISGRARDTDVPKATTHLVLTGNACHRG